MSKYFLESALETLPQVFSKIAKLKSQTVVLPRMRTAFTLLFQKAQEDVDSPPHHNGQNIAAFTIENAFFDD